MTTNVRRISTDEEFSNAKLGWKRLVNCVRQTIKYILCLLLYYSGILFLFKKAKKFIGTSEIRIISYHGVNDGPFYINMFISKQKFESQIKHLKRHFKIIGMAEAEEIIKSKKRMDDDFVVITLDDGYKDNYENVFPIAVKYRIPMTIYLTTGCITDGCPTTVYYLILAVHGTAEKNLDLSSLGLRKFELDSAEKRERAILEIDRHARGLSYKEREEFLEQVLSSLGFGKENPIFQNRMLSWDDVNEMVEQGIVLGGHSVTHPILSRLPLEEAEREIRECREEIQKMTGRKVTLFAYPYGDADSISDQIVDFVRRSDFSSAVVLYQKRNSAETLHTLGRTLVRDDMTSNPFGSYSEAVFSCEMSGLLDTLFWRE